jgi:hypothetical protein
MVTEAQAKAIPEFWAWLAGQADQLAKLVQPSDTFWDEVLKHLKAIDEGLWIELSRPDGTTREFVVTAAGDASLFPLVADVVSAAPALTGWKVIALKPPQGFEFTTNYEGLPLDPRQLWFLPLIRKAAPAALGLRVGVEGLDPARERDALKGVGVVLDTALGERAAALELHHLEVCALPEAPAAQGYFKLAELAHYIEFHHSKHPAS